MKRGIQLLLVFLAATFIAAVVSHGLASWLKVHTKASDPITYGEPNGKPPAFMSGSSLAGFGIDWDQIGKATDTEIKTWGIAGGSPVEFEQFQKKLPDARATYIVVSAYDLDEANFCDFRAALVPLRDTVETLVAVHTDWTYSQRALSQYPMTWLRVLFPTLGRSRGIMGLVHDRVAVSLKHGAGDPAQTEAAPILEVGKEKVVDNYRLQRLSDWPETQIFSKRLALRASFQGADGFDGPKRLAFERMIQYGCKKGRTVVIVLPVSSSYSKEFMSPDMVQKFEAALAAAQQNAAGAEWLRLDQVPGVTSDDNFCDLVHLNFGGQKLATGMLQARLKQLAHQP